MDIYSNWTIMEKIGFPMKAHSVVLKSSWVSDRRIKGEFDDTQVSECIMHHGQTSTWLAFVST